MVYFNHQVAAEEHPILCERAPDFHQIKRSSKIIKNELRHDYVTVTEIVCTQLAPGQMNQKHQYRIFLRFSLV